MLIVHRVIGGNYVVPYGKVGRWCRGARRRAVHWSKATRRAGSRRKPWDGAARCLGAGYGPEPCDSVRLRAVWRWCGWAWRSLAAVLLVVFLLPTVAFADYAHVDEDGPWVTGMSGSSDGYVVSNCNSEFGCALSLIGRKSDYPQLTNEMCTKLSNEGSGGKFYELAQKFKRIGSDGDSYRYYPSWFGTNDYQILYVDSHGGFGNVWAIETNQSEIASALEDYTVIKNGGSLGGGGVDSTVLNAYYVYGSLSSYNVTFAGSNKYTFGVNVNSVINSNPTLFPENVSVSYNDAWFQNTNIDLTQYDVIIKIGGSNASPISFYLVPSGHFSLNTSQFEFNGSSYTRCDGFTIDGPFYSSNGNYTDSNGGHVGMYMGSLMSISGNTLTFTGFNDTTRINMVYNSSGYIAGGTWGYITSTSGSGGGGGGNNNWPAPGPGGGGGNTTDPEPPTPPEPDPPEDEPTGPGIELPDPYNPTTTPPGPEPTPTTPVSDPTNTTAADYTPWLAAILSELRGIHADMNSYLSAINQSVNRIGTNIGNHIDTGVENIRSALRFLYQWMDTELDTSFYQLKVFLSDLAEYIVDGLNFTYVGGDVNVPAYDDTSLIGWLRRIYLKLDSLTNFHPGTGYPTTPDLEDGFDWWAWLLSVLDQLFNNVVSDLVGDVEDFLEGFRDLFPFSVPWDMVAIFTFFAAQPVTPEWDVVIPAVGGWWSSYTYHIDLAPYDNLAATVRLVESVLFAFYLLMKSDWLLELFDKAAQSVLMYFTRSVG